MFEQLFEEVVAQCLAVGLVRGDKLSVDGTFVEANASKESRIPREQLAEAAQVNRTVREYLAELEMQNPLHVSISMSRDTNSQTALLSLNSAVVLFLGSYRVGNRAAFSDSRSNFHTRVGYRTNVCRRRLASDLARASERDSGPRGSRGSP